MAFSLIGFLSFFFQEIVYFTQCKIILTMTSKYILNRISLLNHYSVATPNTEETNWANWRSLSRNSHIVIRAWVPNPGSLWFLLDHFRCMGRQENSLQGMQGPAHLTHNWLWAHHPSTGTSLPLSSIIISQAPTGCSAYQRKRRIDSAVNHHPAKSQIILMFFKHIIIKKLHAGRKIISI